MYNNLGGSFFPRGLFLFSKAPNITFGVFNEKHTSKRVYLAYFQSETYRLSPKFMTTWKRLKY